MQEAIVVSATGNASIFATLPTGGGKSLCYLLPALMRYQRRNLLTIIISPLQALMKDQVDNFSSQTGTRIAAALYGMLTMVERGEILEGTRLGDIGILYVSPEQLRNHSFIHTINQREIGAWVFDEAHCLSKWGHDFRPDYLYAIRFIREFAQVEHSRIPPVQCFTATAKKDVRQEIIDTIQRELGLRVHHFAGGHERTNLLYDVFSTDHYEKYQTIAAILDARYDNQGSVIIYCSTRKNTEKLAAYLQNAGYDAEEFHAGLDSPLKKRRQESFIQGELPIICATNAFGMGIDKDDVRLVIHADIPGSLENYLQEAGRAGRDRKEAECILVFDEQDIEQQFRISAGSRLSKREIAQMLRAIRYAAKGGKEVVLTAGELLRQEVVEIDTEEITDTQTRVRTAIAWLERAGFLERNENQTRVFQGKPCVRDMQEAMETIKKLNLSRRQQHRWLALLRAMIEMDTSDNFSADELALLSAFETVEADNANETETQRVIKTLQDMQDQGLLSKETSLSGYLRYKVSNSSVDQLQLICGLEKEFITLLEGEAPEVETERELHLDLRQVNQRLIYSGYEQSSPEQLKRFLYGLSKDGKGLAAQGGSLTLRAKGGHCFSVSLKRGWEAIRKTVQIRQQAAHVALQKILSTISPDQKPSASLLVEFSMELIVDALKQDLSLLPLLKNPLAAAERALMFMHEQSIVELQQGLAVFSQAMTMRLYPEAKKRRYSQADFTPLSTHYMERNFQIHVMNEYARQALTKISSAMRLVASYFTDDKEAFINRFFPEKQEILARATSEQSHQKIVEDLNNQHQADIVSAPLEENMLVLAGPGAGKTRVIVHRAAYLLRVVRVHPRSILVLCFNRSAAISLRRRLRDLAGPEALGVRTMTFHGLALTLTGQSLAVSPEHTEKEAIDFSRIVKDAIHLLEIKRNRNL